MRLTTRGPEETEEIGRRLGRGLKPGDVVALCGDLGSGKTTMVKGIAGAVGLSPGDIVSASFTIITEYPTDPPFLHIDLYRISGDDDLDSIGFWESMGRGRIAVIEWAEQVLADLPAQTITVSFTSGGGETREIAIEGIDQEDWDHL